jgi:radical SAM-linked protein
MVFGAPLPAGMAAERELLDLFLVRRCTIGTVRDALATALPEGHELVDLHDVWLGVPALSGQVAAADYRVRVRAVEGPAMDLGALATACQALIAAASLPRTRDKGGRQVQYDLRPLLASVSATGVDPDGVATLRIRTRFDQERGVGRPEEVVAAIGDALGLPLKIEETVRERLLLIGEV